MMKKKNAKNSGFTLVETLVAISIFSFSILGLLSVLSTSIANSYYAKQKIIATYLAQEGIEYFRNMRDTYVVYNGVDSTQTGWTDFNTKVVPCASANGCYFQDNTNYGNHSHGIWVGNLSVNLCSDSNCTDGALRYDPNTGKYGSTGPVDSGFVRKIKVTPVSGNETKIISTVTWKQGSGNFSINFSESVFNWIE